MRGLKTLSSFLILGLALVMAGAATAAPDDYEFDRETDFDASSDAETTENYLIYSTDGGAVVEDKTSGDVVHEHDDIETDGSVAISEETGHYAYTDGYDADTFELVVRDLEDGSEVYSEDLNGQAGIKGLSMDDDIMTLGTRDETLKIYSTDDYSVVEQKTFEKVVAGTHIDEEYIYKTEYSNGLEIFDRDSYEKVDSVDSGSDNWRGIDSNDDYVAIGGYNAEEAVIVDKSDWSKAETLRESSSNSIDDIGINDDTILIPDGSVGYMYDTEDFEKQRELTDSTGGLYTAVLTETEAYISSESAGKGYVYDNWFTLPEDQEVTEESTNLATGDFALTSSAGIYSGIKGVGAVAAGLGAWELGVEDWLFGTNDDDEQLWKSDIRGNAVNLEDQRQNILNSSEISNDALFGDAMASARAEGTQSFNNGSTRDEAKEDVETTVEDYYSDVERTIVNGFNNEVLNLQQDKNNAENADVDFSSVFKEDFDDLAVTNDTYTLPNGEEIDTYEVVDQDGTKIMTLQDDSGTGLETESNDDHDSAQYVSGSAHYDLIQDVRDTRSDAISNVNEIIDNIFDNYEQGEINVSDELSALELTEALSTDYGETGSYDYAAASLARTGEPTDLDSAFEITYDDEELEGALFASDDVVGDEVEINETYDGSDGNAVFVSQGENEAELVELDDEFTVEGITSTDGGEELDNTSLQTQEAYDQDVNDLQSEIDSLQKSYEDATESSGGPTGGFASGTTGALGGIIVALFLILAGAYLA